ncbi:MAG: hypothetical protein FWE53_00815 [Firmicutes bacterium]|nr:hypothetical protein [Bacillota bacterium]
MEHHLHIKSAAPMLITLNGTVAGTLENNAQKISAKVADHEVFLCCYPIGAKSSSLSYAAKLNLGNNPSCSSDNIVVTVYPNNHIELLCRPFLIAQYAPPKELCSCSINNGTAALVETNVQSIIINENSKQYSFALPEPLNEYALESVALDKIKCVKLSGKTAHNRQYLLYAGLMANRWEHLLDLTADKIEAGSDNSITSLALANDIAKHGYVEKYVLSESGFSLAESYTVYMNEKPQLTANPHLMPYAFMEAINISNLPLARKYLSEDLSTALNNEHLLTFFGDYSEVCWHNYADTPTSLAVIYGDNLREAKIFNFVIDDGKITNITETA